MKIINQNGYSTDERLAFKPLILDNTIESLKEILKAMPRLKINLNNQDRINDVVKLFEVNVDDIEEINNEIYGIMKRLWTDVGVKSCYSRSREYQLNDSAA